MYGYFQNLIMTISFISAKSSFYFFFHWYAFWGEGVCLQKENVLYAHKNDDKNGQCDFLLLGPAAKEIRRLLLEVKLFSINFDFRLSLFLICSYF